MIPQPIRRRDVFRRGYRYRSSVTGRYVTRLFAFFNPRETVAERAEK